MDIRENVQCLKQAYLVSQSANAVNPTLWTEDD